MNLALFFVGVAKLLFGGFVAVLGIFLAFRALSRLLRGGPVSGAGANAAIGVLEGAALVALGILARQSVMATFEAADLLLHRAPVRAWVMLAVSAAVHVGFSLLVGTGALLLGIWLFNRLTPEVDELDEVRKGNVASAVVLGAILIVLALLTAPGLEAALEGLIPYPSLPPDVVISPS